MLIISPSFVIRISHVQINLTSTSPSRRHFAFCHASPPLLVPTCPILTPRQPHYTNQNLDSLPTTSSSSDDLLPSPVFPEMSPSSRRVPPVEDDLPSPDTSRPFLVALVSWVGTSLPSLRKRVLRSSFRTEMKTTKDI